MTAEVLSRLGCDAVSFSDSHAALAAFEAAPTRFDVVLTGEIMPDPVLSRNTINSAHAALRW